MQMALVVKESMVDDPDRSSNRDFTSDVFLDVVSADSW
jgi:hypothetical protein